MNSSATSNLIDHAAFIALLAAQLPHVYAQIDAIERGLLHCEMAVLERLTKELYALSPKLCGPYFLFINDLLLCASPEVKNAIELSFIEGFLYGNAAEKEAYKIMPQELQEKYLRYANV